MWVKAANCSCIIITRAPGYNSYTKNWHKNRGVTGTCLTRKERRLFSILPGNITVEFKPYYSRYDNTLYLKYKINDLKFIQKILQVLGFYYPSENVSISSDTIKIKLPYLKIPIYKISDINSEGRITITLTKE